MVMTTRREDAGDGGSSCTRQQPPPGDDGRHLCSRSSNARRDRCRDRAALSGAVHPFVIGFFRAFFGALILLPWIALRPPFFAHASGAPARPARRLQAIGDDRAVRRLQLGPLADVTAIAFTSPIFVVLGAALTLANVPVPPMIAAVALGFAGAMLVIGPSATGFTLAISLALAGAVLQSAIQLISKSMSKGDATSTLVVWNLLSDRADRPAARGPVFRHSWPKGSSRVASIFW